MKTYELESFLKSFLIFFLLLEVLLAISFWHDYQVKKREIEERIQIEMKLCAYTLQCEGLHTDFVDKDKNKEKNILYKDGDFYSYFSVPTVKKYLMKVVYPRQKYLDHLHRLEEKLQGKFLLYTLFAALVSLLFSIYALMPLHRALRLNEEFVKDILHDFNTPLSSMKINLKLFKREIGENPKIERLENNIESIMSLQNNLQTFLKGALTQIEKFDVRSVIDDRVAYFKVLYPDIHFQVNLKPMMIKTNKDAFVRIVDNLLSNAGKYNKESGQVLISLNDTILSIEDTGKGIEKPSKVFKRYYKEQDRGIGIGLHIVKKLCDEMQIGIRIKSKVHKGTKVTLDLSRVLL